MGIVREERHYMLVVLPLSILIGVSPGLLGRRWLDPGRSLPDVPRGSRTVLGVGVLVGLVTGTIGAGGGFVVVPALVLLGGLGIPPAALRRGFGVFLVVMAALVLVTELS